MEQPKAARPTPAGATFAPAGFVNDEGLARILDGGTIEEWRGLYDLLSRGDESSRRLQEHIYELLLRVPTSRPYVWLTVLTSLGYAIDWTASPRQAGGRSATGAGIDPAPRAES